MDTPELIYAAQKGNLQAFNWLIRDYVDLIYRILSRAASPSWDTEALTQAAIQSLYQKLPGYRQVDFRLWIIKNSVNFCRSAIKQNPSRPKEIQWTATEGEFIRYCLGSLPFEERLVVILVDMENLNYGETATVLGIPVWAVQSRLARARRLITSQHSGVVPDRIPENPLS